MNLKYTTLKQWIKDNPELKNPESELKNVLEDYAPDGEVVNLGHAQSKKQ